jgi:ABC-type nitrate/sulfonate/bicarbonate transport system permease component
MTALETTPPSVSPIRRRGPRRINPEAITWITSTLIMLVAIWFLATVVLQLVPERILPSPVSVATRFGELLVDPFAGTTLLGHTAASLGRWLLGVVFAVVIGVPLGFLLAWIPIVRSIVAPVFELLRYIPPFAWIPIAVLWMGANTSAQALVVFIAAFPAIVINSRLGVTQADPLMLKASRSLGAGSMRTLVSVVTPVAAAASFTGIRIGFGNGWMALVGAELVVGKQGLGNLILQGQANLSTPTIVVGMISIALVATLFDIILQRSQKLLFPWAPENKGN